MLVFHVDRAACARTETPADGQHDQIDAQAAALGSIRSPSDGALASQQSEGFAHACSALEWLDGMVQHLNMVPGFRDKVLLLVALGWGSSRSLPLLQPGGGQLLSKDAQGMDPADNDLGDVGAGQLHPADSVFASVQRPTQSFEANASSAGAELPATSTALASISPLLVVRRLPAVIRVDRCTQLGVAECLQNSGDGPIAAQHLLPELAFKLGRAPKYGA